MKTLEKVSDFVGKYMAAIVIVVAALALLFPGTFSVVKTAWVNTLLGIVMFGMGLTLKPEDFKVVFSRPKDVIIGCIAQFTLMPFLAWALTQLFHLPTELAIGVILVGTCPGGTSSNVMTYLSKGDVALSVGMTAVSTVLAPFLTPLLTLLYAGQRVNVNPVNMFLSIVKGCWCPSHWALWSTTSSMPSPKMPSVCCRWSPPPPSCSSSALLCPQTPPRS